MLVSANFTYDRLRHAVETSSGRALMWLTKPVTFQIWSSVNNCGAHAVCP